MAEVGLLPFARVALQVATQVLPPYRTRFSKHQFTQPQLLAVLCLMRYEDWTFREAEVRLREHQEPRRVATASRARLHHVVSFSAAAGGRHRRSWIAGNRASAAATPTSAPYCRHRRHRGGRLHIPSTGFRR